MGGRQMVCLTAGLIFTCVASAILTSSYPLPAGTMVI